MGWLTGWDYRKSHIINYAAGAGTLYQKRIKAHYGSGTDSGEDVYLNSHSRTDFGDVRFTDDDGVTLLDYWIESKVDSDYAIIWVEVADDLSTVNQTIYVYYGKTTALSISQGDNVFARFDDFNYDPFASDGRFYGYDTGYNSPLAVGFQWVNPQAVRRTSGSIDRTYITYARKSGSSYHVMVTYFDHNTKQYATPVQVVALYDGDAHRNPAILVDSSGYIFVFFDGASSNEYVKRSTNVNDISAWSGLGTSPDYWVLVYDCGSRVADSLGATYPNVFQIGTTLYCFFRLDISASLYEKNVVWKKSTDGGATWTSQTTLFDFGDPYNIYAIVKKAPDGSIHAICHEYEYGTPSYYRHVYYLYSTDGGTTWKKRDGTTVTLPATRTTADKAYNSDGTAFNQVWDLAFDSNSNPYIVCRDGGTYKFIKYSAGWLSYTITTSGDTGGAANGFLDAIALYVVDSTNFKAYLTKDGTATKDGGELQEWTSTNSGVNWSKTKDITKESETGTNLVWKAHNFPRMVENANPNDLLFMSCFGDTDGYVNVYGWGLDQQLQTKFQILRHENLIERYTSEGGTTSHANQRIEITTETAWHTQHFVFSDSIPTNVRRSKVKVTTQTLGTNYRFVLTTWAWQKTLLQDVNKHALYLNWFAGNMYLSYTPTNGGTPVNTQISTTSPIAGQTYTVELCHSGTTTHVKVVKDSDQTVIVDQDVTTFDMSTSVLYGTFGQYCGSTPTTSLSYFDNVLFRKYVDPEPAHGSWGSEETEIVTKSFSDSIGGSDAFVNPYRAMSFSEVGGGSEVFGIPFKALPFADAGQGLDAFNTPYRAMGFSDTGTGIDAFIALLFKTFADAGLGSDVFTKEIIGFLEKAFADAGLGSDVFSIPFKALRFNDVGAGTDAFSKFITFLNKNFIDAGLGSDSFAVLLFKAFVDTGFGSDAFAKALVGWLEKAFADSGIGTDVFTIPFRSMEFSDVGSGTDSFSKIITFLNKLFADSGFGSDAFVITFRALGFADVGTGIDVFIIPFRDMKFSDVGHGVDTMIAILVLPHVPYYLPIKLTVKK